MLLPVRAGYAPADHDCGGRIVRFIIMATIAIVGRADVKAVGRADVKAESLSRRLVPRPWRSNTSESRQQGVACIGPQSAPIHWECYTVSILDSCYCACTALCVGGSGVHIAVDIDPQRAAQRLAALIATRESAAHNGQRNDRP